MNLLVSNRKMFQPQLIHAPSIKDPNKALCGRGAGTHAPTHSPVTCPRCLKILDLSSTIRYCIQSETVVHSVIDGNRTLCGEKIKSTWYKVKLKPGCRRCKAVLKNLKKGERKVRGFKL